MDKVYTAAEMREMADNLIAFPVVQEMLRQAADALERKEKREKKKYEYAQMFLDGTVAAAHHENPRMVFGDPVHGRVVVRREVGEWEEVKDDLGR